MMSSEESRSKVGPTADARYIAGRLRRYYRVGAAEEEERVALQTLDAAISSWMESRNHRFISTAYLSRDELARCLEAIVSLPTVGDAIGALLGLRGSGNQSRRALPGSIPAVEVKNVFGTNIETLKGGTGDIQIGHRYQQGTPREAGDPGEAGEQRRHDRQPARPPAFPWDYGEGDVRVSVAIEGGGQDLHLRYSLEQRIQEGLPGQTDFYQPLSGPIGGYFDERLRGAWKRSEKRGDAFLEGLRRVLDGRLVPPALRRRLEDLAVGSCLVEWVTELAAVPWELLSLPTGDGAPRSLCEVADCARILPGWHRLPDAGGRTLGVVIAEPRDEEDELHFQRELEMLRALAGPHRQVLIIPPSRRSFLQALSQTPLDVLHLVGHGRVDSLEDSFRLSRRETLGSDEIAAMLGQEGSQRPLVFLNSCFGGHARLDELGVGGFAQQTLRGGAFGFLGPQWEIPSRSATRFAEVFYHHWLGGRTLGRAVRLARQALIEAGDRVSALSYVAYGHPAARVRSSRLGD